MVLEYDPCLLLRILPALPDLILLLQRDGTVLGSYGGRGAPELKPATDPVGNTSEFSQAFVVPDNIPPTVVAANFDVTQGPNQRVAVQFSENVAASLAPTDLFQGDVKYTTDFRSVYAAVLDDWLRTKSEAILGRKFDPIKLV